MHFLKKSLKHHFFYLKNKTCHICEKIKTCQNKWINHESKKKTNMHVKNDMSSKRNEFVFFPFYYSYNFFFLLRSISRKKERKKEQCHNGLDFCILSDSISHFMLLKVIGCDGTDMKRLAQLSFGLCFPKKVIFFDQRRNNIGHPTVILRSCRTLMFTDLN